MTVGAVPLAPMRRSGTDEVVASMRLFISEHDAILLENDGVVVTARHCGGFHEDGDG